MTQWQNEALVPWLDELAGIWIEPPPSGGGGSSSGGTMTDISNVVSVTVKVQDAIPAADAFGVMAVFAYTTAITGMHTYTTNADGLAQMLADGIPANSAARIIASIISSGSPKVTSFKLWPRSTHAAQTIKISPTILTQGYVYNFTLTDGIETALVSYTVLAGATAITNATAIAALITPLSVGNVTGTHAGSDAFFTLGVSSGTDRFWLSSVGRGLTIEDTSTNGGIATDLDAAVSADPEFFGVVLDTSSATENTAAAAWAEANERIFLALSSDTAILTSATNDVASTLKTLGYNFTSVVYSQDGGHYANAALMGRQFSQKPGSSSFHAKKLPGVATDNLNATELGFCRGKNAIPYVSVKTIPMTFDGKAAGGRFLDLTIGIQWLKSIIQSACLIVIANAEKVDMSNEGISEFVNAVSGCMGQAEAAHLLLAGWTVSAPDVRDISVTDRGNRLLNQITFDGTFGGGIHKVQIAGTVSI